MEKKPTVETISDAIRELITATSTLKDHYATEVQWRLKACTILEVIGKELESSNKKLSERCIAVATLGREL